MPLTWISGLLRLHWLPELRGPPEAQGVVRPVFGSRPPVFPFFPPRATSKPPTPLFLRKTPIVPLLWTQFSSRSGIFIGLFFLQPKATPYHSLDLQHPRLLQHRGKGGCAGLVGIHGNNGGQALFYTVGIAAPSGKDEVAAGPGQKGNRHAVTIHFVAIVAAVNPRKIEAGYS